MGGVESSPRIEAGPPSCSARESRFLSKPRLLGFHILWLNNKPNAYGSTRDHVFFPLSHSFPDKCVSFLTLCHRQSWFIPGQSGYEPRASLFPPKVFLMEGSQNCSQPFSKPESACTEDVQFVASQFDLSQTGEFPVSGSGHVSVVSSAFC